MGKPLGMLFGGAFFFIPAIGPLIVMGPLAMWLIGALEGAALGGAAGALAAALTKHRNPERQHREVRSRSKGRKISRPRRWDIRNDPACAGRSGKRPVPCSDRSRRLIWQATADCFWHNRGENGRRHRQDPIAARTCARYAMAVGTRHLIITTFTASFTTRHETIA